MGRIFGGGKTSGPPGKSIGKSLIDKFVWGRRFLAANAMSICMLENEIAINKPKIIQLSHLEAMAI